MEQLAAINFIDRDSGDRAYASVRVAGEIVGVGLSLMSDGDIEVSFGAEEARELSTALARAADIAAAA